MKSVGDMFIILVLLSLGMALEKVEEDDHQCALQAQVRDAGENAHEEEGYPKFFGGFYQRCHGGELAMSLTEVAYMPEFNYDYNQSATYQTVLIPDPQAGVASFWNRELYFSEINQRYWAGYLYSFNFFLQSLRGLNISQWLPGVLIGTVQLMAAIGPQFANLNNVPNLRTYPLLSRPYLQGFGKEYPIPPAPLLPEPTATLDPFSAQVIGYSGVAYFFQKQPDGRLLLDYATEADSPGGTMLSIVAAFVKLAPVNVLRCRAYFNGTSEIAELLSIDIWDNDTGSFITVQPNPLYPSLRWQLAKMVLHVMDSWVFENFHSVVHLYSALVTTALQLSTKQKTTMERVFAPHTFRSVLTLFQMVGLLHADHDATWTGRVYEADIEPLRATIAAGARVFLGSSIAEITGCTGGAEGSLSCPTGWWAGGATEFSEAIYKFTRAMAGKVVRDTPRCRLVGVEKALKHIGLQTKGMPKLRLHTKHGLAKFFYNLVFLQSIFHSGYWSPGRENLSPIGTLLTASAPLLPSIKATPDVIPGLPENIAPVLDTAYPEVTRQMELHAILIFGGSYGVTQMPELGQDFYWLKKDEDDPIVVQFNIDLNDARERVKQLIPPDSSKFVPYVFYPLTERKPVGHFIALSTPN